MALVTRLCVALLSAGLSMSPSIAAAQTSGGIIDAVHAKAAFLFNVVKFVQWPASDLPADRVVIGVVARPSFRRVLEETVNGKSVNGRSITVRDVWDEADARQCHIVYFDDDGSERRGSFLRRASKGGVLTVGETNRFVADGGHVRVYVDGDRLRFQVDPAGLQQAGLKVSAQFLSLAK